MVRAAWEQLLGREGSPHGAPQMPLGSTHRSPSSSWAGCGWPIAGLALGPWALWVKELVGGRRKQSLLGRLEGRALEGAGPAYT